MPKNPNWTQIVRDLLKEYTQVELSEKTGISQSVISDINCGKPKKRISYDYGVALVKPTNNLTNNRSSLHGLIITADQCNGTQATQPTITSD